MSGFGSLLHRIFGGPRGLDAREAKEFLTINPDAIILDVRQAGEFRGGHLPKAKHAPVGLMPERAKKLDKDATYLVYCLSGARSSKAAAVLAKNGFKKVYKLHGGIRAWERSGFPVSK